MSNNVQGGEIDFKEIPLKAVSQKSKTELALLLDIRKILPCEDGYPRDWRGLVDLAKLQKYTDYLKTQRNPTQELLKLWIENKPEENIAELHHFLGLIDRWDVIDDTREFLKNDAIAFLKRTREQQLQQENAAIPRLQMPQVDVNPDESDVYTVDDIPGGRIQMYDAFVLFAEDDTNFALELTERMERDGELKFCLQQRDLVAGNMEYQAMTKLILERCRRLIVIMSPAFFTSDMSVQHVNLAQALGIYTQTRKVIPVLYKACNPPPNIRFCTALKFGQDQRMYDFWDRLKQTVQHHDQSASRAALQTKNVVITKVITPSASPMAVEEQPSTATTLAATPPPARPRREVPIMPPPPRLRSSKSMSSLALNSTVPINTSNCDMSTPVSVPPVQVLDQTAKKSSNIFKKFSSTLSLNSTKENVTQNGSTEGTLKKKKKKETKIAIAEEIGEDSYKKDKSRKLPKFLQRFKKA